MENDDGLSSSAEVVRGTFWGLAGTFVIKILSFLYTIYMAYAVSQGDVGVFNLALGILVLLTLWKDLGLPAALVRYVPYYEGRGESAKMFALLRNAYVLDAAVGLLLTAAMWLSSGFIAQLYGNPALGEALRLMSFVVLADNLYRIGGSFLQGRARIAETQALSAIQVLSKLLLTVAFVTLNGPTFASLAIPYVLSACITLAASVPLVAREQRGKREGPELSWGEIGKEIAPFGIMLMAVQTFNNVIASTDKVVLGYLAPASSANELVAIYSMAVALGGNLMVFPAAVGGIFLPVISRMVGKGSTAQMKGGMASAHRWVLFLTLPMAAVMIAFSAEMLSVFFGSEYGAGGGAMALFVAGLLFSVFSYTANLALAGMRLVALELKIVVFAAAINVVLNFALIPVFGMEGAALAAAASFAASGVLFIHYGKKAVGFSVPVSSYRLLFAGALLLAALLAAKPAIGAAASSIPSIGPPELLPYAAKIAYLAVLGAVSAASFAVLGGLALILRCFEREDITVMHMVARRAYMPHWLSDAAERFMQHGVEKK